ncbi:hypothetical protein Tco_0364605 [Tanacetum coccineum]
MVRTSDDIPPVGNNSVFREFLLRNITALTQLLYSCTTWRDKFLLGDLAAHAGMGYRPKEVAVLHVVDLDLDNPTKSRSVREISHLQAGGGSDSFSSHTPLAENFIMHGHGKTVNELHAMLKLA